MRWKWVIMSTIKTLSVRLSARNELRNSLLEAGWSFTSSQTLLRLITGQPSEKHTYCTAAGLIQTHMTPEHECETEDACHSSHTWWCSCTTAEPHPELLQNITHHLNIVLYTNFICNWFVTIYFHLKYFHDNWTHETQTVSWFWSRMTFST